MQLRAPSLRERILRPRENAVLGVFGLLLMLAWAVVVAYCVYPALPYNSIHLPGARAAGTLVLAPQGWAFFTRDAREEKQFVYGSSGDGWRPLLLVPHARFRNVLGLNRKSRAQGAELALLLHGAEMDAWQRCEGAALTCLRTLPQGITVQNHSPNPTLCGIVAVISRPPVPWAWLRSSKPVEMPSRILPLQVVC